MCKKSFYIEMPKSRGRIIQNKWINNRCWNFAELTFKISSLVFIHFSLVFSWIVKGTVWQNTNATVSAAVTNEQKRKKERWQWQSTFRLKKKITLIDCVRFASIRMCNLYYDWSFVIVLFEPLIYCEKTQDWKLIILFIYIVM